MNPIKVEFKEQIGNKIQDDAIELVELLNFLFSDEYKLAVKNDTIISDLKTNSETWYSVTDYELFKNDFHKKIDKGNKSGSYDVKIKGTNQTVEWAFFDTKNINLNSELRLFRFISNGNYLVTYFHNVKTNVEIDLMKTNLGQLYEALPIIGTTDYKVGKPFEVEILKKLESNKYRFDFSELNRICKFCGENNLKFRLRKIDDN